MLICSEHAVYTPRERFLSLSHNPSPNQKGVSTAQGKHKSKGQKQYKRKEANSGFLNYQEQGSWHLGVTKGISWGNFHTIYRWGNPRGAWARALLAAPSFPFLAPRQSHPTTGTPPPLTPSSFLSTSALPSYRLALSVSRLLAVLSLVSGGRLRFWRTRLPCAGLWLSWSAVFPGGRRTCVRPKSREQGYCLGSNPGSNPGVVQTLVQTLVFVQGLLFSFFICKSSG